MHVQLTVTPASAAVVGDLAFVATITNPGPHDAVLSTQFLATPSVVLQVKDAADQPVPLGPPPVPPEDDGTTGRRKLAPGDSLTLAFRGGQLFGRPLVPGRYQVRVHVEIAASARAPKDWAGRLESEWISFVIGGG